MLNSLNLKKNTQKTPKMYVENKMFIVECKKNGFARKKKEIGWWWWQKKKQIKLKTVVSEC